MNYRNLSTSSIETMKTLRELLYYDLGKSIPQSTFNLFFEELMTYYLADLKSDIDQEVMNIEEYKNSLEDE